MKKSLLFLILLPLALWSQQAIILCYHRFAPTVDSSMTTTNAHFEAELTWLLEHGYTIVPLRKVVDALLGRGTLPNKAVAITADDGHRSVYSDMAPIVKKFKIPVTLFIYPSSISKSEHSMTWEQLAELKKSGLFDIQSHTYWSPNFKTEKRRLTPDAYRVFVDKQLLGSKKAIEAKLGGTVDLLAWPFGIYDTELQEAAKKAGYIMAFSIDRRPATPKEHPMAQPRYMILDRDAIAGFINIFTKQ